MWCDFSALLNIHVGLPAREFLSFFSWYISVCKDLHYGPLHQSKRTDLIGIWTIDIYFSLGFFYITTQVSFIISIICNFFGVNQDVKPMWLFKMSGLKNCWPAMPNYLPVKSSSRNIFKDGRHSLIDVVTRYIFNKICENRVRLFKIVNQ